MMETWKDIIIQALTNLGGKAEYVDLYEEIARIAPSEKILNNDSLEQTVRNVIHTHSSDSQAFDGDPKKDIFYSVEGRGKGVWGLR